MSFYDALKDAISIAQKTDNIDLYKKLLDLSKDALEQQNEVYNLTIENQHLKEQIEELSNAKLLEDDLELQPGGYLIRLSEKNKGRRIMYCAACWQNTKKLMPYMKSIGMSYQCSNCQNVLSHL